MKTVKKNIVLDTELNDWLMSEANKLGLTFSSFVRMILTKAMNEGGRK